jgi:hypothetical protein
VSTITKTTVGNLALAHLGDHRIDDIDEDDPAAADLRDQWDIARLDALSAYEWAHASKTVQLDRNATAPIAQWTYAYDKPADWIKTNAVADSSEFRRDVPFRNWMDREGQIQTDALYIYMDYVYDHTTVGSWPAWFVDFMSASLAQRVNPKITTSHSHGKALVDMQKMALAVAKARDAQQQPIYRAPPGNWIRARRGAYGGSWR